MYMVGIYCQGAAVSDLTREEIIRIARETAMDEADRIVKPVHEWQLAFWSNGSGRPPGHFQSRCESDDRRYSRLEAETRKQSDILTKLDRYVTAEEIKEEQRKQDAEETALELANKVRETERKSGRRVALWGLIVAIVMAAIAVWDHYDKRTVVIIQQTPAGQVQQGGR